MFITIQNHIVQTAALQHIELASPTIHIHIADALRFKSVSNQG